MLLGACDAADTSDDAPFFRPGTPSGSGSESGSDPGSDPDPDPVPEPEPEPEPPQNAEPCQWPTSVMIDWGACSGVLIHPSVVLTAGHCITAPQQVMFGEFISNGAERVVDVSECASHPEANGVTRHDYGYCLLAEPVDLAIVPPLLGCELDWLVEGQPTLTVSSAGSDKHVLPGEYLGWYEGMLGVELEPQMLCHGDSGGPTYVRLPDQSWRVVGVSSGGHVVNDDGCVDPILIVPVQEAVAWIEEQTGIDVSPCHLADGTWAPGPECTGLASDPALLVGSSAWIDGTCPDARELAPATCGPGFGHEQPDSHPPEVDISSPADGAVYPNAPARVSVYIAAHDDVAVLEVELFLDGELLASQAIASPIEQPPVWAFENLSIAAGEYRLSAVATDYWGNVGESEPVMLVVGDPPADEGGWLDADEQDGCACSLDPQRGNGFGLALFVLLGAWLRPRKGPGRELVRGPADQSAQQRKPVE